MLSCDRSNILTYFPHACLTNTKTPPLLRPCWLSFTAGLENCRKSGNNQADHCVQETFLSKITHILHNCLPHIPCRAVLLHSSSEYVNVCLLHLREDQKTLVPHHMHLSARAARSHVVLSVYCRHCPPSQTVVLVVNAVYLRS